MLTVSTETLTGWVFNIQRFSLHDGPGIRTTVFLKGCPLHCIWCHNPEGWNSRPQIRLATTLCAHCGRCEAACEHGGHTVTADQHELHLDDCIRCGRCADACPAGALELVGGSMSPEEVLAVVRRDLPFYDQSGGGMTLSGGEPLAQYDFSVRLLEMARAEEIRTAMETTAIGEWGRIEALLPLVDLFMVDIKHTDTTRHKQLTGVPCDTILANIRRLVERRKPLILRVPFVPGMNVEPQFLAGLQDFLLSLDEPPPVELMLYHRLGLGKWESLGGESPMPLDIPAATKDDAAPWIEQLTTQGIQVRAQ